VGRLATLVPACQASSSGTALDDSRSEAAPSGGLGLHGDCIGVVVDRPPVFRNPSPVVAAMAKSRGFRTVSVVDVVEFGPDSHEAFGQRPGRQNDVTQIGAG
jgi:hypothetical protein